MLTKTERNIVEMIRRAKSVKIIINEGDKGQVTLTETESKGRSISRLAHEVAIAFQYHWNALHAKEES